MTRAATTTAIRHTMLLASFLTGCGLAAPVAATGNVAVSRIDDARVRVTWTDADPVTIFVVDTPAQPDPGASAAVEADRDGTAIVDLPQNQRRYLALRDGGDGSFVIAAERLLPLEHGSNFRDIGGYEAAGGKHVAWGRIFRSGAQPMLSESDYRLIDGLGLTTVVDLRSLEERVVVQDMIDDRTGALFVSNDYSIKPLFAKMNRGPDVPRYAGSEQTLKPQFRALFQRLLADDGATLYHCSAGQDRTGIATALILSALGVDRETILADYHLSTGFRRPENEMPKLDPADYPGNPIVAYYAASQAQPGGPKAEPLYTADGRSHLAMFLTYLDERYGGVEAYLQSELGIGPDAIRKLQQTYLD